MSKIKNIIIFVVIAAIFISAYIFYIKKSSNTNAKATVASTSSTPIAVSNTASAEENQKVAQDFLNLLLSVKKIKLNDGIFTDIAFTSLHDSSIVLIPDGTEGRVNPFAPLGVDAVAPIEAPLIP